MDPLSVGRACYRKKDYNGAMKAFTEMIIVSTDFILLTALDHRAATYEKLKQLHSALRDAKNMIELKPEFAKGYLRCGKVLQLKGSQELALRVYERGLQKVKVGSDPERTMLQESYNKLLDKQQPKETYDPLVKLPTELMRMVLRNLEMRELVLCLSVSKSWKCFLEGSYDLWTRLDLRNAKRPVNLASIKAHVRRSNYTLHNVFLTSKSANNPAQVLKFIVKTCKNLELLDYFGTGTLGESLVAILPDASNLKGLLIRSVEVDISTVVKALTLCPLLEDVVFNNIKIRTMKDCEWPALNSLKNLSLTISELDTATKLNLQGLISASPNLRSVFINYTKLTFVKPLNSLLDLSEWSKLEELQLTNTRLIQAPAFPLTLKRLRIFDNPCWEYASAEESASRANIPLLETLQFPGHHISSATISDLMAPSIKAGNLKNLDLAGRVSFDGLFPDDTLVIPSLESLSLKGCTVSEGELLSFLRRCPGLRRLNIASTHATGVTVKEVMTRDVGPLEYLDLNLCFKVSPDAVAWARGLGTSVQHRLEESHEGRSRFTRFADIAAPAFF